MKLREDIRNIAIIAHVDHGKTTMVDELLKQSDTLDARAQLEERAMDSNDIEKERGITILAKNTAVSYKGNRINIMDTPGHADFGGEVERIMKMVDGVLLIVDSYEGTMPQTRFVLKKALEQKLIPIVVINKIDKPTARTAEVVDEVLELFIELGADDDQLEFPVVYASGLNGTSSLSEDPADQEESMDAVFDTVLEHIPAPVDNSEEPLQFQVAMLDYNDFVGRIGIGRVDHADPGGEEILLFGQDGAEILPVGKHHADQHAERKTDDNIPAVALERTGVFEVEHKGRQDDIGEPQHIRQNECRDERNFIIQRDVRNPVIADDQLFQYEKPRQINWEI